MADKTEKADEVWGGGMIEGVETYIWRWTTLLESPERRSFRKELMFSTPPAPFHNPLFILPTEKENKSDFGKSSFAKNENQFVQQNNRTALSGCDRYNRTRITCWR